MACACGQTARYAGRRPKTFTTVLGPLTLERAYYHCDTCQAGVCPRDRALGLHETSLSPATTRMVGLAALSVSFAEAGELLKALAGVAVDPKQVERTAEALGRDVADDECKVVEPDRPPRRRCTWGWRAPVCRCASPRWKGAAASSPTARQRPARSSSSPCGTAATRNADGLPERDPGSVSYSAAVESAASRATDPLPSPFGQRAYREAQRRGFDTASRRHRRRRRVDLESGGRTVPLTRNRHRMRYPQFRAWGLCVASGVVEAGCKHAIGARLKRAGMH